MNATPLKSLLKRRRIQQLDIAVATQLSPSTVNFIVHGKPASLEAYKKVAGHLNISLKKYFPNAHADLKKQKQQTRQIADYDKLRLQVLHELVDKNLTQRGSYKTILELLSQQNLKIHASTLSLALNGKRCSPAAYALLQTLYSCLLIYAPPNCQGKNIPND